jgi:glycosyltransferase involved in cell wall biosynthesis
MTWQFDGARVGAQMVQQFKPLAIWSTYPIATAHVIAARLRARFGLPWIADFRDPMVQDDYPPEPKRRASFQQIEETTLRSASASVFTTPGAAREYERRYPEARICVIENGYDEESFAAVEDEAVRLGPLVQGAVTILHSGIVYPSERDPTQLMAALARLKKSRALDGGTRLVFRFRAAVHEELLASLARRYDVTDLIELAPPVPYRDALTEMLRADGLLVLQAANCNEQIPVKVYEYLRARRPILALTDLAGDTARLLETSGVRHIAPLDDATAIASVVLAFLRELERAIPDVSAIQGCSRQVRTKELVALLGSVLS